MNISSNMLLTDLATYANCTIAEAGILRGFLVRSMQSKTESISNAEWIELKEEVYHTVREARRMNKETKKTRMNFDEYLTTQGYDLSAIDADLLCKREIVSWFGITPVVKEEKQKVVLHSRGYTIYTAKGSVVRFTSCDEGAFLVITRNGKRKFCDKITAQHVAADLATRLDQELSTLARFI